MSLTLTLSDASFLPTNLAPEYGWTVEAIALGAYICLAVIFFAPFALGIWEDPPKGKLRWVRVPVMGAWLLMIASVLTLVVVGFSYAPRYEESVQETRQGNKENFVQNIQAKYAVEEVDLEGVEFLNPSETYEIEVKQDGVLHKVIASQDTDSFEPTLEVIIPFGERADIRENS